MLLADFEMGAVNKGQAMHDLATTLWPYNRSITGPGLRQTLDILSKRHDGFRTHHFKTGTHVFDWEIPREWTIWDAYIEHESGQRFAEFAKNNLSVLGYAAPLDIVLDHADLDPYLYTQPDQPDRIPYVTSYYKERSGFCMRENEKAALPTGKFRLFIDSEFSDGEVVIGECVIPGESDREILFSTYICHPSMANNELSGPVLADQILQDLAERKASTGLRYTYRVLFLVETIGSIAYLSRFAGHLKAQVDAGFVLSCVGDERAYSHVESRFGTSLADRALNAALKGLPNTKRYSFLQRGSDERQFCAPGIDLPVCGFCKSKYGEYQEYHTDADDLTLVTPKGLSDAHRVISDVIGALEHGLYPKTNVLCEPQMGKRGLYPTISQKGSYDAVRLRMDTLAYADGQIDVFDMCERIGVNLGTLNDELEILTVNGLISTENAKHELETGNVG
ncbi:DUF4910 domain-containing protein [Tateyamaria sp.]